jgi:hypothetical protein
MKKKKKKKSFHVSSSLNLLHGDGLEAGPDEEGRLLILLGPSLSCELTSLLLLLFTPTAAALLGLLVK